MASTSVEFILLGRRASAPAGTGGRRTGFRQVRRRRNITRAVGVRCESHRVSSVGGPNAEDAGLIAAEAAQDAGAVGRPGRANISNGASGAPAR